VISPSVCYYQPIWVAYIARWKIDLTMAATDNVRGRVDAAYIQVAPHGVPLTPAQYAGLITTKGPLGGPVDCVIDVGGSGEQMRVLQTEVTLAPDVSGPQFAAAAYGSPSLPKDGQWSVVSIASGGPATPVDPQRGASLVREGNQYVAPVANPNPYRFADPADLLNATPASDLGLLHVSGRSAFCFRVRKLSAARMLSRACFRRCWPMYTGCSRIPAYSRRLWARFHFPAPRTAWM